MKCFQRILWIVFLVLMLCRGSASAADSSEAVAKFVSAKNAYSAGDFEQAAADYEAIVALGWESGSVYYNLGNAYVKLKRLGKALINYERARRLIPRDGDLQFNIRFVESKLNLRNPDENIFEVLMRRHIEFYAIDEMIVLLIIFFFAGAAVFLVSMYFKWTPRLRVALVSLFGALLIIFAAGLVRALQEREGAAVVTTASPALFEPRENATAHFDLAEGSRVKILRQDDSWVKIIRPDGKSGWVPKEKVEEI